MDMPDPPESAALLAHSHALPAGPRVRLRLVRRSDLPGIRRLFAQRGVEADDLGLSRLVRYDPWTRAAICATALIGGSETLVGVGAIDLEAQAEPDTLVVDERLTDGLGELLSSALVHRARSHARRVA